MFGRWSAWAAILTSVLGLACGFSSPEPVSVDLGTLPGVTSPPSDADAPQGRWTYEERCGETVGGTTIGFFYTLKITGNQVALDVDGFQTMSRLQGAARSGDGGEWELVFTSFGPENTGGGGLAEGDVLFTFAPEAAGLRVEPRRFEFNCSTDALFAPE